MTQVTHDHALQVALDAADRSLRRWSFVERALVVLLAVVVAAALAVSAVSVRLDLAQEKIADTAVCQRRAIGLTLVDTLTALSAPPVPVGATPAEVAASPRGQAIAAGHHHARPLTDPKRYC